MFKRAIAFVLISLLFAGFVFAATDADQADEPQTLAQKFSYAFGIYLFVNYGENASNYFSIYQAGYYPELDYYYGYMGMYDCSQGTSLYSVDELNGFLKDYPADYAARMEVKSQENLKLAEDFLKENKTKSGIKTTASGLQYKVIKQGTGAKASAEDSVELDYELKLLDGTVVDSSYARGEHSTFPLSSVIPGFKEGVMLMPMGSHYIFYIHPDLGYGAQATGSMEPNSLLIFEVETYSIAK